MQNIGNREQKSVLSLASTISPSIAPTRSSLTSRFWKSTTTSTRGSGAKTCEEAVPEHELDYQLAQVIKKLGYSGHIIEFDCFFDSNGEEDDDDEDSDETPLVHREFIMFPYKGVNRLLRGTLLHYSIWKSKDTYTDAFPLPGTSLVSLMLQANAEIDAKASYTNGSDSNGKEKPRTILEAIHLAAGLGNVNALQVLADHAAACNIDQTELVNKMTTRGNDPFYAPIHEAAFLGQVDAVRWLLTMKARPDEKNVEGFTALHWMVVTGLSNESELEGVVQLLVSANAKLDASTETARLSGRGEPRPKIPMEVAVLPGSRYPRKLLVHLSPGLNTVSPDNSFLRDLCVLASLNKRAAEEMARSVVGNSQFHPRVRATAQEEGEALMLAYLLSSAPFAAADVLDVLYVKPKEEDSRHHPIPARASLWGLCHDIEMRVTYQCDYRVEKQQGSNIMWPLFKYSIGEGQASAWHSYLFKGSDKETGLNHHMYDVETNVLLFPNLMDVHILMALTTLRRGDMVLFHRLPIQACISAGWRLLVKKEYLISTFFFGVLELVTLLNWGFIGVHANCRDGQLICSQRGEESSPLSWTIVLAGALRDAVTVVWWFAAYSKCREEAYLGMAKKLNSGHHKVVNLNHQWAYTSFFSKTGVLGELLLVGMKFVFLFRAGHFGTQKVQSQKTWLCLATIIQCWRFVYSLRVVVSGFNMIIILIHTFFNGIMVEVLALAVAMYLTFAAAFLMLKGDVSLGIAGLNLYRSLIMADGETFDKVGLNQDEKQPVLTLIMVVATLLFNIVMLNLIIAIYTTEYAQTEKDAISLFFKERAWIICHRSLGQSKLPMWVASSRRIRRYLKVVVCLTLITPGCVLLLALWGSFRLEGTGCISAAFSIAFGQSLWQALLSQSFYAKMSQEDNGEARPRFVWACHSADLREHRMMHLSLGPAAMKERFSILDNSLRKVRDDQAELKSQVKKLLQSQQQSAHPRRKPALLRTKTQLPGLLLQASAKQPARAAGYPSFASSQPGLSL